ncbi:hypothetical protein WJX72_004524 [[Myrmecia] bisecta]|uniref:Tocopherol cyclase n=1 Tax=[Myrmecia] bisecta TaxID=41462 RepID=A0AAW1QQA3_9CHLO
MFSTCNAAQRFFEGWYFKIALPGEGQSFAFMYSVEDPTGSGQSGVGAQVMGPDDSYLIQYTRDISCFWADKDSLALGASFKPTDARKKGSMPKEMMSEAQFNDWVDQGFAMDTYWHQGSLVADESDAGGYLPSTVQTAKWAFSVRPIYGWGDSGSKQKSTAGWMAALPVFEPHWQVLMAHGLASGWVEWEGKRYDFKDAPSYSEKNWGGGFPKKWFWITCNTFAEDKNVAVTAVGARRGLLQLPGVEEDVGMIGVHWQGKFIELVPWNGEVQWEVEPWGKWRVWAKSDEYEAVIEATSSSPGTALRAPTATEGLAPACRDSFCGKVHMQIWQLDANNIRRGTPMLDVTSSSGAVEVGGGPWWSTWQADARMREPLKSLINVPIDVEGISRVVPPGMRPPGL